MKANGPFRMVAAGDMSGSIVSTGFDIRYFDNPGIQWSWTGNPVGVLKFQCSVDSTDGINGTWDDLTMTINKQPAGSADHDISDLNQLPYPWVRVAYTPTSGAGVLNAVAYSKRLG